MPETIICYGLMIYSTICVIIAVILQTQVLDNYLLAFGGIIFFMFSAFFWMIVFDMYQTEKYSKERKELIDKMFK